MLKHLKYSSNITFGQDIFTVNREIQGTEIIVLYSSVCTYFGPYKHTQSQGNFGILLAGQGKYPADLNT